MSRTIWRTAAALALTAVCGTAYAVPTLQLGGNTGAYCNSVGAGTCDETWILTGSSFNLTAFLTPGNSSLTTGMTYYISVAVVPQTLPPGGSYGSFTIGGTTVNVTQDMFYGTPPLDTVYKGLYGDLPGHGIFETYFYEFAFTFSASDMAELCASGGNINTQTDPSGGWCLGGSVSSDQFFKNIAVDISNLSSSIALHFDLYNEDVKNCTGQMNCSTVVSVDDFAPFSHDAQTSSGTSGTSGTTGTTGTSSNNPEPASSSLVALGLGLLGFGFMRRRRQGV